MHWSTPISTFLLQYCLYSWVEKPGSSLEAIHWRYSGACWYSKYFDTIWVYSSSSFPMFYSNWFFLLRVESNNHLYNISKFAFLDFVAITFPCRHRWSFLLLRNSLHFGPRLVFILYSHGLIGLADSFHRIDLTLAAAGFYKCWRGSSFLNFLSSKNSCWFTQRFDPVQFWGLWPHFELSYLKVLRYLVYMAYRDLRLDW